MGHIRKTPCGQWQKPPKHRNGRPHRAAKIAPGLCLGAIPYLAPLRRNRAAVRREGELTRGTQSPSYYFYIIYFLISSPSVSGSAVMVMVNLMPSLAAKLSSQFRKSTTCSSELELNILWKLSMNMCEMS